MGSTLRSRTATATFLLANAAAAFAGALGLATGTLDLGPTIESRLPLSSPVLAAIALATIVGVPLTVAGRDLSGGVRQAPDVVVGAGIVLAGWIGVQVATIRSASWLQVFYAGLAAVMIVRGSRVDRSRLRETPGPERGVLSTAVRCLLVTIALLGRRRLHLRPGSIGQARYLPDGRRFDVYRETERTSDVASTEPVTLSVWFHLRGISGGARVRQRAFERVSLVNTMLFAGVDGFLTKLWMVDPATGDWAGLYTWDTAERADRYGRYITAVLRPFCRPGSVGHEVGAAARTTRR